MRLIGRKEIENIALGASFFGAGGGGNPYVGKMMAIAAIEKFGPVKLVSTDEIEDDGLFISVAGMGAPTVLAEKIPNGNEYRHAFEKISQYTGKQFTGVFPIEAGGVNSMIPLVVASQLGIPLVDCDTMGRAFPELQMTTLHLGGINISPLVITDEKGNISVTETVTDKWAETILRAETTEMGGQAAVALYPCTGADLKQWGVHGIVSQCEVVGRMIEQASDSKEDPYEALLRETGGFRLFQGKIVDVIRTTKNGFNFGTIQIDGLDQDKGSRCEINFQNENKIAKVDDHLSAVTPDLIILVDTETLVPVTTENLKYGKRVRVLATKANPLWRTKKGIETTGPRYFGYDMDFEPVEDLQKEEV
ncbi:DUF917 domain-containing protein [uncultured Secundilactobacillus sp.]|uniref:DUF917 domain-containing protein n=1 Tax=uncultured Secundilactobacillus sp. TaxID=2813935 RepID=UPI00258978B0|nr:DUF917 domain-containing protein [uncultured Secundilactobacillus sp.]